MGETELQAERADEMERVTKLVRCTYSERDLERASAGALHGARIGLGRLAGDARELHGEVVAPRVDERVAEAGEEPHPEIAARHRRHQLHVEPEPRVVA